MTQKHPPTVPCDLCSLPFVLPPELVKQGVIYGLLVCSACVADELEARASLNQPQPEAHP